MKYDLYDVVWIFLIYSFIGWCIEVIYAAVVHGCFVNRGFNTGPACPIYGFGMLSVVVVLEGIKDNLPLLFFASVAFTSALEFLAGFVLEKFFHEKWWDYTNEPFNLGGYICLKMSLLWGFACVFVIHLIHPTVMYIVHFIPKTLGIIFVLTLLATVLTDSAITLIKILKVRKYIRAITEIEEKLNKLSVSIGTNLSNKTLAVMDTSEKLKETFDEKSAEAERFKESWAERIPNKDDLVDAVNEKRDELEDELRERMEKYRQTLEISSKHIRHAFPNIAKGKYKYIFKLKK